MEGAGSSPPASAGRLRALPSLAALSEPANASVENTAKLTPAARTETLGMRFTLHLIDERRYGELARTRNRSISQSFAVTL
jgi:hypothetical protein